MITIKADLSMSGTSVNIAFKQLQELGCKIERYEVSTVGELAWISVNKTPEVLPKNLSIVEGYKFAEERYAEAMLRVKNTPEPEGQKFHNGQVVKIIEKRVEPFVLNTWEERVCFRVDNVPEILPIVNGNMATFTKKGVEPYGVNTKQAYIGKIATIEYSSSHLSNGDDLSGNPERYALIIDGHSVAWFDEDVLEAVN